MGEDRQGTDLIARQLAAEFKLEAWQVDNVLALIGEGNTIPFIARYRKEKTGSMSDEVLRDFSERLTYLQNLEAKKEQVMGTIEEQGKLTPELKEQICRAATLVEVEDLYRPYRPKRRTRATIAKERGLEPLAMILWQQDDRTDMNTLAEAYVDGEKDVATVHDALQGAKDIMAELVADEAEYRKQIRSLTAAKGLLTAKAKNPDATSVYEMYYDYQEPVQRVAGHRILALNRGEAEKILSVSIEAPTEEILQYLEKQMIRGEARRELLEEVIEDAYKRLIAPSIENEIRGELTEKAQDGAIHVFGKNLTQLLMQPPIAGKTVLGLDPAFRTGCKLAVVDATGKVLDTAVIYPTSGPGRVPEAKQKLKQLIAKHHVDIIAIGNGTASRESEMFVVETLKEISDHVSYIIVNEAGASVYSASKLGTEEFPNFDVALRSAVSIGRRLQDPLAELVKIDPKSIGVGQYQHDMNQAKLSEALTGVVEDCVNKVGVDVNTASPSLLSYISGISKTVAKNIVTYREETGRFRDRRDLLKVSKLGPKAYEQCAGFLRIQGGDNPLDNTAVHPESYEAAQKLLSLLGYSLEDVRSGGIAQIQNQLRGQDEERAASQIGVGIPTLKDILSELAKPGRDPRDEAPAPILRTDVLEMKDLREGMVLKGTVRNVIDFGVFVDIGVHQDGLVHISQLSNKFVKHPLDVVSVGDVVDVKVISLDLERKRIGLSMRL